jgi:hypothetical protein
MPDRGFWIGLSRAPSTSLTRPSTESAIAVLRETIGTNKRKQARTRKAHLNWKWLIIIQFDG